MRPKKRRKITPPPGPDSFLFNHRYFPRHNSQDMKRAIESAMGSEKAAVYFDLLRRFLSAKLSKWELDYMFRDEIGPEYVPVHNDFLTKILYNARCHELPPSARRNARRGQVPDTRLVPNNVRPSAPNNPRPPVPIKRPKPRPTPRILINGTHPSSRPRLINGGNHAHQPGLMNGNHRNEPSIRPRLINGSISSHRPRPPPKPVPKPKPTLVHELKPFPPPRSPPPPPVYPLKKLPPKPTLAPHDYFPMKRRSYMPLGELPKLLEIHTRVHKTCKLNGVDKMDVRVPALIRAAMNIHVGRVLKQIPVRKVQHCWCDVLDQHFDLAAGNETFREHWKTCRKRNAVSMKEVNNTLFRLNGNSSI